MSINNERIFVVGATGSIGSNIIRSLVKKGIDTTAYVRDESKAKQLFHDELLSGHLTIAVGTYSTVEAYASAIEGHTRLFLLVFGDFKRATSMKEVKETFGRIAYEKGVRQIVDLSSFTVRSVGKESTIGYMHTSAEEQLWRLADEQPNVRSLVVLRPGVFMSNQLTSDAHTVKQANKLILCASPSAKFAMIDPKDISDCAVVVLTESIEKHDRSVYEMGGEFLSNEQRAEIFSKILGRPITYEQQPIENTYNMFIGLGMPHSYAYSLISLFSEPSVGYVTPQVRVLLNRPLRTLEEWLQENIKSFQ